nr:helix-turn-helix transcriptional regulator [Methylocystis sp. SC2]
MTFGDRLRRILLERNMSQSDLARLVWNETKTDARGYEVVVGKDRISAYVNNRAKPEPRMLKLIADALKMPPEELAPEIAAKNSTAAAWTMEEATGQPGMVLFQFKKIIPHDAAIKILAALSEAEKQGK